MPQNKKVEFALLLVATLGIMSGITIVSSLPLISKTFANIPHIEFLSKLMLTIPSIIIALFSPIAGIISDRFGRLKPLFVGIVLFVVGGSSGFYLHDFYIILLGRAILGIGVALIMTASTALIGDYFSQEKRHQFMAKQGMVVALGGILFISSGGLLAQLHWSYPFAIYLIPIAFIPYLLYTLYEPKIHTEHKDSAVEAKLLPVYITAFFIMVLFYMMPTQFPYLIINRLHGEPKTIGFIIATAMVFNAIAAKQYAKIKAKLDYIQIYAITFALFASGLYFIAFAKSVTILFVTTIPIGIGFGLLLINTNAWFLSLVPPHKRGKASGILTSSLFLGQFSSPIIFEPIVSNFGIQKLFLFVAIASTLIALTLFVKSSKNPL
jgi:MFS family permease